MAPKQLKIKDQKLIIKWNDESEQIISLKYLRNECPCANCKGETVLLKTYRPPQPAPDSPEKYSINKINTVGGYAVQIFWKDGHNTGIYSWDYLKQLADDAGDGKKHDYDSLL